MTYIRVYGSNPYYRGPSTDHFGGTRFFNPDYPTTDRSYLDLLRWRFTGKREQWPKSIPGSQACPRKRVDRVAITMIGHASLLVQAAGQNILVDPVWSERASLVQFAGPKRVNPPGIEFDHLPPIDVVLITHTHYDHLDTNTIARTWRRDRPRIIAALGTDVVIKRAAPAARPTRVIGAIRSALPTVSRSRCIQQIIGRHELLVTAAWRYGAASLSKPITRSSIWLATPVTATAGFFGKFGSAFRSTLCRCSPDWSLRAALVHDSPTRQSGRGRAHPARV